MVLFGCWNGRPELFCVNTPTTNIYCLHMYLLDVTVYIHYCVV